MLLDARKIAALAGVDERTARRQLRRLGSRGFAHLDDRPRTNGRPPWVIDLATFLRVTGIHPDDAADLLARLAA